MSRFLLLQTWPARCWFYFSKCSYELMDFKRHGAFPYITQLMSQSLVRRSNFKLRLLFFWPKASHFGELSDMTRSSMVLAPCLTSAISPCSPVSLWWEKVVRDHNLAMRGFQDCGVIISDPSSGHRRTISPSPRKNMVKLTFSIQIRFRFSFPL
jgi:hypothetical protein